VSLVSMSEKLVEMLNEVVCSPSLCSLLVSAVSSWGVSLTPVTVMVAVSLLAALCWSVTV